jgi:hypothetical protein
LQKPSKFFREVVRVPGTPVCTEAAALQQSENRPLSGRVVPKGETVKELIEYIAQSLVDDPNQVQVGNRRGAAAGKHAWNCGLPEKIWAV